MFTYQENKITFFIKQGFNKICGCNTINNIHAI